MSSLVVILSLGLTLSGWSQDKLNDTPSADTVKFGQQPCRVSEIIGSQIKNYQGHKVGAVKDLAVDLDNGRIVEVIVDQGGSWGGSKPVVAVPPDSFLVAGDGKTLFCSADKDMLAGAPVVEMSRWNDSMQPSRVEDVYRHFGLKPYFLTRELMPQDASHPVTQPLGEVKRASQLLGLSTVNRRGERLGNVQDLIADLPLGRAAEFIVDTGGFLGIPGELSADPPQAMRLNSDNTLTLDTTKETLLKAPHFSAGAWPEFDRGQIIAVYQAYHVPPYLLPAGLEGAANGVGLRDQTTPEPMNLAQTPADMDITLKIRADLRADHGLAAVEHNVRIATIYGRVILRGMVTTFDEKQRVGEVAARTVSITQVENQLEIREATISASN
jgi:sporulation protein YlmC with PRC-barrel domain